MTNLQNSLSGLASRLTHELTIPLIITWSVLDVLEENGYKITDAEKLEYLQVLQVSITEISQSLDQAIKEF